MDPVTVRSAPPLSTPRRRAAKHLPGALFAALLFGAATCAAPDGERSSAQRTNQAAVNERDEPAEAVALAESSGASERLARARARFGAIAAGVAVGFDRERDGAVRPRFDDAHAARLLAEVVLPELASGAVRLADPASGMSVAFTLEGAADVPIEASGGIGVYPGALRGADVVHRPGTWSTEDFVLFEERPRHEAIRYEIEPHGVAGLRLVARVLELLDERGAPRMRINAPYLIDARGVKIHASLEVERCAVDRDPRVPWGRPVTAMGAATCGVVVSWEQAGRAAPGGAVVYPALLDPEWTTIAGLMSTPRTGHTSTRLPNNTILVAGGFDAAGIALTSAEIFCPTETAGCPSLGEFMAVAVTDELKVARGGHTETLLASNDRVLVTGGRPDRDSATSLASAEIYTFGGAIGVGSFGAVPVTMSVGRSNHTATLLAAGAGSRVLVAGSSGTNPSTAELFDPVSQTFGATISMVAQRSGHVAEVLDDGKVLIAGGIGNLGIALSSAELFDPAAGMGAFSATMGNMTSQRAFATATRLDPLKNVLIAGGTNGSGFYYQTADIFIPAQGIFQQQSVIMQTKRANHAATRLPGNNKVLITGGTDGLTALSNTESFEGDIFSLASEMNNARNHHTVTLLVSGQVISIGGGVDPISGVVDGAAAISAEILLRSNGEPCATDGECASGSCAASSGGICCDQECADICEKCVLAQTGFPDGECHFVPAMTPVSAACAEDVQFELVCDGTDNVTPGDVQQCSPASCDPATKECRSGACTGNDQCAQDSFCNTQAGQCESKRDLGAACGVDVQCTDGTCAIQCTSGRCVDNRCCASECTGQCEACDVGNDGICAQVTGAPHGARAPCDGGGSECEGTCESSLVQCDYEVKPCGTSTCDIGARKGGQCHVATQGVCSEATVPCAPYACDEAGVTCVTECASVDDCTQGHICRPDGTCVAVASTECDLDHTVIAADGTQTDCTPYKCQTSSCLDRCRSIDECVAPAVCDAEGACIPPPPDPAAPSGCTMAGASARSQTPGGAAWLLLAGAALAPFVRRARRRRTITKRLEALFFSVALVLGMEGMAVAQPATPPSPPGSATTPAPGASSAPPPATSAPDAAAPPAAGPAAAPEDGPNPANKAEAELHFKRGLKLFEENAWTAALAEFLLSRELYPTRTATNNAAVCLRKLNRFDEALDMYETLLREFVSLAADKKSAAQKEVAELRELVGTIDITGSEPGASIVVDGRTRQDYPLIDPLRVSAGTHIVRVIKAGFEPFEAQQEVAGGQTVHLVAKLRALTASGRLRVTERSGKALEVVVDGAVVGVTPWEGVLAIGEHVVLLRGDEDLGTQPAIAPVKRDEATTLTLAAEALESSLLVEVTPPGASVTIDAIPVGRGVWDGRLRKGDHTIEAFAEGFFPAKEQTSLDRGERKKVRLVLQRDDDAAKWRTPAKITFDVSGGFAMAPSFGGDVAGGCDGDCSSGIGVGGAVLLHAGYEFGSGFGLGLAGGYLHAEQDVTGRAAQLEPTGLDPRPGTTEERLRLRGFLVGVTAGMHIGERFPARFRLGAGALIGSIRSDRVGQFMTRSGETYQAPELANDASAAFVYIDPEASIGIRVTDQFELSAGLQALILINATQPKWGADEDPMVVVPKDGLSSYPDESLAGGVVVVIVPGISARYTF